MRTAHQGVAVAPLPGGGRNGWMANLVQGLPGQPPNASDGRAPVLQPSAAQQSAPQPAAYIAPPLFQSAPERAAPSAQPHRSAPVQTSARPEAAAGLDGWLMDRLFGR
jgi:penicillin-binding protein 1A